MTSDSGLLFWATLYIVSGGALNSTHSLTHASIVRPINCKDHNYLQKHRTAGPLNLPGLVNFFVIFQIE